MTERTVRVRLEGDASHLEATLTKSERGATKFEASLAKTGKTTDAFATTAKRASVATDGLASSKSKASKVATAFEKAINTAKGGTAEIGKAALAATAAFGPWGIAIGVVGSTLWGLIDAEREATKRTKELREELEKKNRILALERQDEKDEERGATLRRKREMEAADDELARSATRRQIAAAIRELEKVEAKGGRGAEAARREIAELKALNAESNKDYETAIQIRHEEDLRLIALKNQVGEKKKIVKLAGNDASFDRALGNTRGSLGSVYGSANIDAENEDRRFAAAANSALSSQLKLDADPTQAAAKVSEAKLRQIEIERATTGESLVLIDREKQARLDLLSVQMQAATITSERQAIAAEMEQVRHEATLSRISQEISAEEQRIATIEKSVEIGRRVADQTATAIFSITDAREDAINAAKAQGKTDKEAARAGKIAALEQTAGQLRALRNLAVGKALEQLAFGIGAQASTWGIPNPASIGHFVAAGVWGAIAGGAGGASRAVGSSATGMRRSDALAEQAAKDSEKEKKGGDSGFRGGRANLGPIPGSPSMPSSGTSTSKGGGNTTIVNFNGDYNAFGTLKRGAVREMVEATDLYREGNNSRRMAG